MDIAAPKLPPDHPEYLVESEFVPESAVQERAEAAQRAGWSPPAICAPIARLGGARAQAINANDLTNQAIAMARLRS
jgi:hypothetical protein